MANIFVQFAKHRRDTREFLAADRLCVGPISASVPAEPSNLLFSDSYHILPTIGVQSASTFIDPDISSLPTSCQTEHCLPLVESINLSVVFEDFADALTVLGRSIDGPEIELRSKPSVELDAQILRPKFAKTRHGGTKSSAKRKIESKVTDSGKAPFNKKTLPSLDTPTVSRSHSNISNISERPSRTSDVDALQAPVACYRKYITASDMPKKAHRYLLKQQYESILPRRICQAKGGSASQLTRRLSVAIKDCYLSTVTSNGKIQADRGFLQKTVQDIMVEMIQRSSFTSFIAAITRQRDLEMAQEEQINRVAELEAKRRHLAKALKKCKSEKAAQLERLGKLIWKLEDEHQETVNRTCCSQAYVSKEARMIKRKSFLKCKKDGQEWLDMKEDMKIRHRLEVRVHASMVAFLENEIDKKQVVCDMWMDKYNEDKENLQTELDTLKNDRQKVLDHMSGLEYQYVQYMEIVLDERRQKKIEERARRRSEREARMATRLSAWWRGTLVRNALGDFVAQVHRARRGK